MSSMDAFYANDASDTARRAFHAISDTGFHRLNVYVDDAMASLDSACGAIKQLIAASNTASIADLRIMRNGVITRLDRAERLWIASDAPDDGFILKTIQLAAARFACVRADRLKNGDA